MREGMPVVSAWIDDLRLAFGKEGVTLWVRQGLQDGTFYATENGHEIGRRAEPENAISMAEMVLTPVEEIKGSTRGKYAGRK